MCLVFEVSLFCYDCYDYVMIMMCCDYVMIDYVMIMLCYDCYVMIIVVIMIVMFYV